MFHYPHNHVEIRDAVAKLCTDFDGKYWQACDAGPRPILRHL